ncbi:ER degradation-enhancing alpha-mannosidase-like protein 2 [Phlebotomus papatasi]|uniref:ER degradation-enhancing alpha-mannosidase-like protein 2 n=1 Tax=Phlebotomus papatasi TaxID=29031 RepID=UPI0024842690|nr:ER degradation-enhancing alpha-mannosidase-like protein 2 [Phlebotomus papatasi]
MQCSRGKNVFSTISVVCLVFLTILRCDALREYTKEDIRKLREEVREMFQHAYEGYLKHASDFDELRPLSCDGVDTWGSYSLTLIDALDTLAVMGNNTEFQRVVDILVNNSNFESDINVSVFETNIRIVGGLLSAHLLSRRAGVKLEPGWPCNGPLLRMAEDVARRLLPAFDTKTGMPYGTVNLKHGIPPGETSVTCTAGVGTFIVEFGALSRLTGDPIYEEVALNALYALQTFKSPIGLFGNHIDVQTGRWTAQDAGIGAGVDSYYEYLVKGALMLNRPELMKMFNAGRQSVEKFLKRDDWYIWVSMNKGQVTLPVFQSLEAYWPGVLSLIGDISAAMKTLHNYVGVWKQYGFLPEFYNIPNAEAGANRENYPLRPELIESVMYLYRATGDPFLLQVGEDMLRSIQHSARTSCGYATIKNVRDHRKEDRMESFFLAETTKYLYLLFDPDNFLNNDGRSGTVINTPNGECVIEAGGYIFNTEAHPIDPAALRCCYDVPRQDLLAGYKTIDFRGDIFKFSIENETVPEEKPMENFTIEVETPKTDPEETRKNIVFEILSILKESKRQEEEKAESSNTTVDDSIILPTDEKPEETTENPVETAKVPPTRDEEENTGEASGSFVSFEDDNSSSVSQNSTEVSTDPADLRSFVENQTENNSLLTEFVQSILKSTQPARPKFDAQNLLEKIRRGPYYQAAGNFSLQSDNYRLLTCRAQSYLQRLSIHGEFF